MNKQNIVWKMCLKFHQNYTSIPDDVKKELEKASAAELEVLFFVINPSEHISEYVLDCLKTFRKYKKS